MSSTTPGLPVARNTALLAAALATNMAMVQLSAAVASISLVLVLGLGWNVSFVAATAELADRTEPWERGSMLGFNDLLSGATGAGLALLGGLVLTAAGVAALAIGAIALVVIPALWILRQPGAMPGLDLRRLASPART